MATIVNEVITNFRTTLDKSSTAVTKEISKSFQSLTTAGENFSRSMGNTKMTPDISQRFEFLRQSAEAANVPIMNVERSFNKLNMTVLKNGQVMSLTTGKIINQKVAMNKLIAVNKRFNFSNLSLLFGFMAINRAATSMMRSLISTYQKANEDTEGLGKATWHLQAAWEFFKYSLIDALTNSELFKILVEALMKVVQWFNELPSKTKSLIAIGILFTLIASAIGLAIVQMKMFAGAIGFKSLLTSILALGPALLIIAAIFAAVVLLWVTNLGNFRDFVKNTFGIIWETIKSVFAHVFKFVKEIFSFLIDLLKGDWDGAMEHLNNAGKNVVALLMKTFLGLGAAIVNIFLFTINLVVDLIFNLLVKGVINGVKMMVQSFESAVNKMIDLYNRTIGKLTKTRLPTIKFDYSSFDKANAAVDKLRDSSRRAYITADQIKTQFAGVNSMLGLDNAATNTKTPQPSTKTVIDNSVKNVSVNLDVPAGMSADEIVRKVTEQINNQLNSKIDSVNN